MKKLTFKKWISITTTLVFMFQQISPAFAMEPLEPREKTRRAKRLVEKPVVPVSEKKLTAGEKKNLIQKVISDKELSEEEEKEFKILSNELMVDLLSIKDVFDKATGPLVIIIGNTGSGKTTLSEWLSGKELRTIQDPDDATEFIFESDSGNIKGRAISKTTCPTLYPIDKIKAHCADCPGLKDTRGVLQKIKNTVYIRELFRNHTSVKFLIAEPADSFKPRNGRGIHFKDVLETLKAMFSDSYLSNHSLQECVTLVVTHYENGKAKNLAAIKKWITNVLTEEEQDEVVCDLLTSFSQPHKIAFFSQPTGPQNPFQNDAEKKQILANLKETKFLSVSFETDIKSSFSNDSIALLNRMHSHLKMDLSLFLKDLVEKELRPCLINKIIDYKQEVGSAVSNHIKSYSVFRTNITSEVQYKTVLAAKESTIAMACTIFVAFRLYYLIQQGFSDITVLSSMFKNRSGVEIMQQYFSELRSTPEQFLDILFDFKKLNPFIGMPSIHFTSNPFINMPLTIISNLILKRSESCVLFVAKCTTKISIFMSPYIFYGYKRDFYEKNQWSENKNSKGQKLKSELSEFREELANAKFDICGNHLFGENGALRKFKPNIHISKIEETAKLLDYLSSLLAKKQSEYSEETWTPIFQDFAQELTQYSAQSGEALYETAEEFLKKKDNSVAILIEDVQEEMPHLSAGFIRTVAKNLETASPYEDVNVTGSPLSKKKFEKLIHYMDLCTYIYTDESTRTFIEKSHVPSLEKKWNAIISKKKEIERLHKNLSTIQQEQGKLLTQPPIYEKKGTKSLQSEQVPSLSIEAQNPNLEASYKNCMEETNHFLQRIARKPIEHKGLKALSSALQELDEIRQHINNEYSFYFSEELEESIPKYKGEYQLTNQAVVAASFLHKTANLFHKKNITILDVGFRNLEGLTGFFKNILTILLAFKHNPTSWFEGWGEVNYVAYLEEDKTPNRKDKIVLVYSGSNSLRDWVADCIPGHKEFEDLSVHEGIGNTFNNSVPNDQNLLIDRLKNYYKYHRKPKKLKIITTGHSLGGALASLAAYYYKSNQVGLLEKITGLNKDRISVISFVFGSPAIVDKASKEIMEKELGKKNIFRIWTFDDAVVNLTDNAPIQRGMHLGISFPLYNIENLPFNVLARFWGPHGTGRYRNYLKALGREKPSRNHERLTSILTNYVKNPHDYETRQQGQPDK